MKWRRISSGSFVNIEYETKESNGQYLHLIKILGPVGRAERMPVYNETLKLNLSADYFCIVDNSNGYESVLTFEDMLFFGDILVKAGIKRFFSAVVTNDVGHVTIGKLTRAIAKTKNIYTETYSASSYPNAEKFIMEKLAEAATSK
ncbi:hypothetical protein [Sneathiella sp.]|uniref:hypothetical protein n=1 Tax=Sneathiella sp. TaxID=1964365 RepID=UPI003563B390